MKTAAAMEKPPPRQGIRRGAYLLPSLFTTGNILLGFYALVLGYRGNFPDAALSIFVAGILDGLDGRIARLTHTESEFGRELDSLADLFTFGAAPAFLCFLWGLHEYGRPGWLIPLFFLICAAMRLARFNVQAKTVDSRDFVGLPAPAGAGAIASLIFVSPSPETWGEWIDPHVAVAIVIFSLITVGSLMVSTFSFTSFKKVDLRRRFSYRAALIFAAFVLVLATYPPAFFLSAALIYTLSGPLGWLWGRFRG